MKNSTYKLIVTILVLVIVLGGAVLMYRAWSDTAFLNMVAAEQETLTRDLAPDFAVVDAQGNQHRLSDYLGTPVILNFWASWCGPCQMEMPEFEEAYQEYGGQIQFMMINLTDGYSDTVESATQTIMEGGYTFPVFFDTEREAAMNYNTSAIPVTCFIDAQGALVSTHVGMLSTDALQQGIDSILSE